eukprot:jgi/Psemu1/306981/fgenesh1_kg.295_\
MVVVNDFEVQLVSAEDKKTPFKEHQKGLNTYVEVEPDAEYFISVRRIKTSPTILRYNLSIDGKCLGYWRFVRVSDLSTKLRGIWSRTKGISTHKALRFVKASFESPEAGNPTTRAGMGEIRMDVRESFPTGKKMKKTMDFKSSFQVSTIQCNMNARVTMKKALRSGEGNFEIKQNCSERRSIYRDGPILYSITLYYCATPGLIAVGVLPKPPPLWLWQRTRSPATTTAEEKRYLEKLVLSVKRNRDGNEILELRDDG